MTTPGNRRANRRGAALVTAIVALAIVGAVSASMLSSAVRRREHWQLAERRAQADWLLHSGIQRAVARRTAEPQYIGENWQPLPLSSVSIRVTSAEEDMPGTLRLEISARCEQAGKVAQRSRQLVIEAPAVKGGP
jgi:hypothetical protein